MSEKIKVMSQDAKLQRAFEIVADKGPISYDHACDEFLKRLNVEEDGVLLSPGFARVVLFLMNIFSDFGESTKEENRKIVFELATTGRIISREMLSLLNILEKEGKIESFIALVSTNKGEKHRTFYRLPRGGKKSYHKELNNEPDLEENDDAAYARCVYEF